MRIKSFSKTDCYCLLPGVVEQKDSVKDGIDQEEPDCFPPFLPDEKGDDRMPDDGINFLADFARLGFVDNVKQIFALLCRICLDKATEINIESKVF